MFHNLDSEDSVAESTMKQMMSYVDVVDEHVVSEDVLSDEEIVSMVFFDFEQSKVTDNGKKTSQVSAADALSALRTLISFQEQLEDGKGFRINELDMLRRRIYDFEILSNDAKKQKSIMEFCSRENSNNNV
jgi:hypothetical protein